MKKKGKKEKKVRKKNVINELETVTFEQQILDNTRQLARLRSRNEELELEAEKLEEKLRQLEESKADLTSHLQQIFQRKTEEAQELQERLLALERLRKDEQKAFKTREESLQQEFKLVENNLKAEITLAAGKLNALEDFRMAKIDLMKKFEEQEVRMAEQETRHKEALYEAEKKLIIGKAKMQTELEKRLSELAASFRAASGLRLAEATQRTVRENVALQQELDALLSHCRELNDTMQDCRENERDLKLRSTLYEAEAKLALDKIMQQNRKIERLMTEHSNLMKALSQSYIKQRQAQYGEETLRKARELRIKSANESRILEQNIQLCREEREAMVAEGGEECRELARLHSVLSQAKYAIQQAILVQNVVEGNYMEEAEEEEACSYCFMDLKETLLQRLLDILSSYDKEQAKLTESTSEMGPVPCENFYEFGNLGLIPNLEKQSEEIKNDEIEENIEDIGSSTSKVEKSTDISYGCFCD